MRDYVTNYEEAVEFIYSIPRFNSNHSLEEIKDFLNRMGRPDRQMKIVHIAGTNGKGSTSAYMAGLLEQCGFKVGLFTSPHLVDVRERFRINGRMISR
ncbi:MAG: bifunctional folylpolyglutamate synthase/dihydrofolate synthase, partial [Lachnospiraceae bacterium]|nr:bifunctional folylpolyglutamate synthase/dihydrofolate synthase [Lachnospiraceae bacterium]